MAVEAKKQVLEESGGGIKKDFWLGSKRFWKSARQVSEAQAIHRVVGSWK